jgi:hypothetical protein
MAAMSSLPLPSRRDISLLAPPPIRDFLQRHLSSSEIQQFLTHTHPGRNFLRTNVNASKAVGVKDWLSDFIALFFQCQYDV